MAAVALETEELLPIEFDAFERVSDVWLPDTHDGSLVDHAFCYVGSSRSVRVKGAAWSEWLEGLAAHVREHHAGHTDFRVEYGGKIFRGHRARGYTHQYLALRNIPLVTPRLPELRLPAWWNDLLMLPDFARGGLIVIAAVTGQGKSTTIAATVRSRLERFGGHAVTLEDPVELNLHGFHNGGFCLQKNVNPDLPYEDRFAMGIVDAMREFPALPKGGAILMVGEVRDATTAGELVRAANNGMLVITTVHAGSVRTALQRLFTLASQTMGERVALNDLASATRLVLHQRLNLQTDATATGWERGRLSGEALFVAENSAAAAVIRTGEFNKLGDVLDQQAVWLNKTDPKPTLTQVLGALSARKAA